MFVQHETRHAELADLIQELVSAAVPWVEKVTGLPLPRPRFELVDVDGLAAAYRSFVRRQMERDSAGLDLTRWERAKLVMHPQGAEALIRHGGMSKQPVLIATSIGRPSTLIVPEAVGLQQLSETPDLLCDLLVRSLAQQAQVLMRRRRDRTGLGVAEVLDVESPHRPAQQGPRAVDQQPGDPGDHRQHPAGPAPPGETPRPQPLGTHSRPAGGPSQRPRRPGRQRQGPARVQRRVEHARPRPHPR